MCTRVSNSDVFHVFWLHVLPNYCNLILKQEWPNPLLYCRNPASETLLIQLACFNRDWESSGAAAEGRPPREAPHFPSMQIHGRKTRGRLLEGSCTGKKAELCSRLVAPQARASARASPRGYVTTTSLWVVVEVFRLFQEMGFFRWIQRLDGQLVVFVFWRGWNT